MKVKNEKEGESDSCEISVEYPVFALHPKKAKPRYYP